MMRRSLIRSRIASALKRSAAWQPEKNAGAEAGNRRQLRRFLAQEERRPQRRRQFRRDRDADDDAEPDQGGSERQSAPPRRPDRRRGGTAIARRAIIGDAGAGERQRGENSSRPGRGTGRDQAAENRADRHAGRRCGVQPGQDRPAEPPLDPGALGVHGDVDDAAEEPRDDQGDGDLGLARGVEESAQSARRRRSRSPARRVRTPKRCASAPPADMAMR